MYLFAYLLIYHLVQRVQEHRKEQDLETIGSARHIPLTTDENLLY